MTASATTIGSSHATQRLVAIHPLFHDLFIAAPAPDQGPARPSRRRQVLTRTVRRAALAPLA